MELAHLHRDGKALQQATSAITDDGSDPPSLFLQLFDATLVRIDGLVGQELPEEILVTMRTPPHHDAEESLEVGRVHDDDHFVGCQFLLSNFDAFQLTLHPLRTPSVLLCDLLVRLFAVSELLPDVRRVFLPLLTTLLATRSALPNLSSVVGTVLLERLGTAMRTYFSWCMGKDLGIFPLSSEENKSFYHPILSTSPTFSIFLSK